MQAQRNHVTVLSQARNVWQRWSLRFAVHSSALVVVGVAMTVGLKLLGHNGPQVGEWP
jgi:hypothetical protein